MSTAPPPVPPSTTPPAVTPPKVSWLKKFGSAIWTAAKDVVGFLGSSQVQTIEQQAATVAALILPADAPIINAFQGIVGKIFQQAAVTETAFTNVQNAGSQKLAAVVAAIGPELDQWVANNFPGSKPIQDATKQGLVNAIVALQNDLQAPVSTTGTVPASSNVPAKA